jgi:hypothetical protein
MKTTDAFERQFKEFLYNKLADTVSEKAHDLYLAGLVEEYQQNPEPVFELPKHLTRSRQTEIFIFGVDEQNDCLQTRDEYYRAQPVSPLLRHLVDEKLFSDNLTIFIEDFDDLKERGFSAKDYRHLKEEVYARGLELAVECTDRPDYLICAYDDLPKMCRQQGLLKKPKQNIKTQHKKPTVQER